MIKLSDIISTRNRVKRRGLFPSSSCMIMIDFAFTSATVILERERDDISFDSKHTRRHAPFLFPEVFFFFYRVFYFLKVSPSI